MAVAVVVQTTENANRYQIELPVSPTRTIIMEEREKVCLLEMVHIDPLHR